MKCLHVADEPQPTQEISIQSIQTLETERQEPSMKKQRIIQCHAFVQK